MGTYYRNRVTGKIQQHPKSGLGERFNADEVGQDGKPIKPHATKGKDKPSTKTPEATTGTGSAEKKEGAL